MSTIDPAKYPLFTPEDLVAAQANMEQAAATVGPNGMFFMDQTQYVDATNDPAAGKLIPYYQNTAAPISYVKAMSTIGASYRILQKAMNSSPDIVNAHKQWLAFINDVLLNDLALKPFPLDPFTKMRFIFNKY